MREQFTQLRADTQAQLRVAENRWWQGLTSEIKWCADTNDMQKFYESTRRMFGPQKRSQLPVTGRGVVMDGIGIKKNKYRLSRST